MRPKVADKHGATHVSISRILIGPGVCPAQSQRKPLSGT